MASTSETNSTNPPMCLKLIVDVRINKVVFAEADNDFVDFIFNVMTLSLPSISKLLYSQLDTVASSNVGALYQSIDALHTDCFPSNLNKDSLLSPKTCIALPLFSFFDIPKVGPQVYACQWCHRFSSDCAGTICPNCNCAMKSMVAYVKPTTSNMLKCTNAKYVRGGAAYVVTDNMQVKPMSVSFVKSLVKDLDKLEEQEVQVGPNEGLAILKAIMENRDVFTSVFLQKKVKEEPIN